MTYKWCGKHIGYGRKRYIPELFIERWNSTDYARGECGYYSDNEIHIAYDKVGTVESLIRTVIHEWTHYVQPARFLRYKEGVPYHAQPCEIQAFEQEELLYRACWTSIRTKIKSLNT